MTTTTTTMQQIAAQALTALLDVPGLMPATWAVYHDDLMLTPSLVGQLRSLKYAGDVRAAVQRYADTLGLTVAGEKTVAASSYCEAFTKVEARGEFMGVDVKIWGAAR